MNWIQRALAWGALLGQEGAPVDPMDPRFWGGDLNSSKAGQVVNRETGLQLDVVQSVLEGLAGTVSTLPLMVFERLPNGGRRPDPTHRLFQLLHSRPNDRQTAVEFRDQMERDLAWERNAYARILPAADGHPIGQLIWTDVSRVMKVEKLPNGWVYYTIRRLPPEAGYDVFREDEIFHLRKPPLTRDGLRGRPVYETSKETIGRALAVEDFGALYFKNGARGGGVVELGGAFKDKEQEQDFLETVRASRSGSNLHKLLLLKYGAKYTDLPVKADEAQFIETKKEMGVSVTRIWRYPPHMAGLLDKATFSNIEQQSIDFVVHTIASHLAAWEQAACRDLLVGEAEQRDYFVEHNVSGLLRGDFKTRWAGYAQGRQWGWLSINDVRRLENMEPIGPEGDAYLQPLNMQPAGDPVPDTETGDSPQDPADPEEERDAP